MVAWSFPSLECVRHEVYAWHSHKIYNVGLSIVAMTELPPGLTNRFSTSLCEESNSVSEFATLSFWMSLVFWIQRELQSFLLATATVSLLHEVICVWTVNQSAFSKMSRWGVFLRSLESSEWQPSIQILVSGFENSGVHKRTIFLETDSKFWFFTEILRWRNGVWLQIKLRWW